MGVIRRGILGGFRGKVANIVGTSWKGIAVMKSLPLSVANPRTPSQQTQRNTFSQVVAVASLLLVDIVKPLWDRFAQAQSGFNAFISTNIDQFDANGVQSPGDVVIANGSLGAKIDNIVASSAGNTLRVEWLTGDPGQGVAADDLAYVAGYNATQERWMPTAQDGTTAADGQMDVNSGDVNSADEIWCYLAFIRPDGSAVSRSDSSMQTAS